MAAKLIVAVEKLMITIVIVMIRLMRLMILSQFLP